MPKGFRIVDTMGLVLMVVVTAGNISDQAGAKVIFQKLKSYRRSLSQLFLIYTDGTRCGQSLSRGEAFVQWAFNTYDLILEAVLRTDQQK